MEWLNGPLQEVAIEDALEVIDLVGIHSRHKGQHQLPALPWANQRAANPA